MTFDVPKHVFTLSPVSIVQILMDLSFPGPAKKIDAKGNSTQGSAAGEYHSLNKAQPPFAMAMLQEDRDKRRRSHRRGR